MIRPFIGLTAIVAVLVGCNPQKPVQQNAVNSAPSDPVRKNSFQSINATAHRLARVTALQEKPKKGKQLLAKLEAQKENLVEVLSGEKDAKKREMLQARIQSLETDIHLLEGLVKISSDEKRAEELQKIVGLLEQKLKKTKESKRLYDSNRQVLLKKMMKGHTELYPLEGGYNVMVIPVQFSDIKFQPESLERMASGEMQDDLFNPAKKGSLRTFYRHSSMGKFDVTGEVLSPVTVSGTRADYGEALPNRRSDKNARGLVKEALVQLRDSGKSDDWWYQFDQWDLNDYDGDNNFREPDGFIDAVVLIYAGKSQSSCQRSFDAKGERPATQDVPPGPRQASAQECFNRIWPHRSQMVLSPNDSEYTEVGPVVDSEERPTFNGLKINDHLFATDYNMQSEYSDISTFIHEFGHSVTLPDIYAGRGTNSVGSWDVMASNAGDSAQELSTYSKISLGWLKPKIVKQGEAASAYLGSYNFVPHAQRNRYAGETQYDGPDEIQNDIPSKEDYTPQSVSIVSKVGTEPVYRSVIALTDPDYEDVKVAEYLERNGQMAVYSGRYDGDYRSYSKIVRVPTEGDATLTLDMIHHIETAHDFNSKNEVMDPTKWTYYDKGYLKVNGSVVEQLSLFSGDENNDTLNENIVGCEPDRVLELRLKTVREEITDEEKVEFQNKTKICQQPTWVTKKVDLSKYRGQEVQFEVAYLTDAGYTDFGIIFDNIKFAGEIIDFEDLEADARVGKFKALKNGTYTRHYARFYVLEYRDPKTVFESGGEEVAYNMDLHINQGLQSMFLPEASNPEEGFRHLQFEYQPGVLVWYYNSKHQANSANNSASAQDGEGYYLVVNPKVQDAVIPGVFSQENLFDAKGFYKSFEEDQAFKEFHDQQVETLACFGYTRYFEYQKGRKPNCEGWSDYLNYMSNLAYPNGRKLIYRREGFNDVLPHRRYGQIGVGIPYRNNAGIRAGLSTFRPAGSEDAKPWRVYRAVDKVMTLDEELTNSQKTYPAVSEFSDFNVVRKVDRKEYSGDQVKVLKRGFTFKVLEPDFRARKQFKNTADANANDYVHRRPRVKIKIDWQ